MGPGTYAKHLISGPRLPFTAAYFGSIGLTLFFAIKVRRHFPHPSFAVALILTAPMYLAPCTFEHVLRNDLEERPADHVST